MSSGPSPDIDHRPPKRPRTQLPDQPPPGPVDHIFIADGVSAKKTGVKKTPLSCCECRRLKLKCDRNFPCASCKKRGCAEICPDGVLVSGKGTRFILANTEQLHSKIHEMSDRIRLLEDALGKLHRTHEVFMRRCSNLGYHPSLQHNGYSEDDDDEEGVQPHPLLHPDLLAVKSSLELYSNTGPGNNQPTGSYTPPHGHGQKNGRDAGRPSYSLDVDLPYTKHRSSSEGDTAMVLEDHNPGMRTHHDSSRPSTAHTDYSAQVARLSDAFPLTTQVQWHPSPHTSSASHSDHHADLVWKDHDRKLSLRDYIRSQLPPRQEAEYLWDQARKNALWQFNPHPSPTFFANLVHHVYHSPVQELCPRRLSLLFMILAVGCHVDLEERVAPKTNGYVPRSEVGTTYSPQAGLENPLAERYHQLARASLCEVPIMEETNVDVLLALFWEIWYLLVFSDRKKAASYAWGIMGLTTKLAQSVGLHRNDGKAKVIPEEVEKRRSLFWELLYLDARLSLSLGRPPSLSIGYVDSLRPAYTPDEDVDVRESLHHYQEWKHSCYIECLSPVLEAISRPTTNVDYSRVIELDRRIRDFPIPNALRNWDHSRAHSRALIMQKGSVCTAVEALLLQLHRTFFTRALSGFDEAFNRKHRYAPSVVAVFLSASRMIASVQDLYRREPDITSRILGYWSNAFSAAVALCMLICRAPFTCLTPAALQEIERARVLFRTAKDTCPRALQVLPILESMIDKANDIYYRWHTGQEVPTMILRHTNGDGPTKSSGAVEAVDPFLNTHSSLAQCVAEVHERARVLFPLRKPCECTGPTKECPPSHSWMPPPQLPPHEQHSPVLPPEAPSVRANIIQHGGGSTGSSYPSPPPYHRGTSIPYDSNGLSGNTLGSTGLYSNRVLPNNGPALQPPPPISTLSPASKMAVVDTLNFELGALNVNTEHNWMAFF